MLTALKISENTAHRQREGVAVRELFAADVEGIEGGGAGGALFEQIFMVVLRIEGWYPSGFLEGLRSLAKRGKVSPDP